MGGHHNSGTNSNDPPLNPNALPVVKTCVELDVRRCRQNAMRYSSHEFSVFCPLDSITPSVAGVLADFSYVIPRQKKRSELSMLPFVGPMWYHRVAVEFGLHHGKITWDDIKFSLSSTGRLPANSFEEPLRRLTDAWEDDHLGKLSVNALVGLMAMDTSSKYYCVTTNSSEDVAGYIMKRTVLYDGGFTTDFISSTSVLSNSTLRPIHDQIMHTEATRVAQLVFWTATLSIPQSCITDVKTDCLNIINCTQKALASLKSTELLLSDLPSLRRKSLKPGQRFLDDNGFSMPPCPHALPAFRVSDNPKTLLGIYGPPSRSAAPPLPVLPWQEFLQAFEAMAHVLAGGSAGPRESWGWEDLLGQGACRGSEGSRFPCGHRG